MPEQVACAIVPGEHILAVHCSYKGGGRYIDVGLVDLKAAPPKPLVVQKDSTVRPAFSLLGTQTLESRSCRKWSDAYKALANRRACNWINVQSAPPMLPPYHAGAAKSRLITRLEEGHNGVKLSARELHLIATWIDLLVPYCGDYTEAMAENLVPKYQKFAAKRKRLAEEDARNIQALLGQTAEPAAQP